MLDGGKISGLDGVVDRDHTCKAWEHSNMAWVTVSSGSPYLGQ